MSEATEPWWVALPPAQVVVECSGERHRVRWCAGRLDTLDHEDPDGERTLAALGGRSCACIDLLDAWSRHAVDLRVLTLASRWPGDVLTATRWVVQYVARQARQGGMPTTPGPGAPAGRTAYGSTLTWSPRRPVNRRGGGGGPWPGAPAAGPLASDDDLALLLAAGTTIWDRLAATVVAEWAARTIAGDERCGPAGPALAASLAGRAVPVVRRWLGDPQAQVDVEMVGPGEPPELVQEDDRVAVRLPFRWLRDLWLPGTTELLGRLCLSLVEAGEHRRRVLVTGREPGTPELVTIALGGDA